MFTYLPVNFQNVNFDPNTSELVDQFDLIGDHTNKKKILKDNPITGDELQRVMSQYNAETSVISNYVYPARHQFLNPVSIPPMTEKELEHGFSLYNAKIKDLNNVPVPLCENYDHFNKPTYVSPNGVGVLLTATEVDQIENQISCYFRKMNELREIDLKITEGDIESKKAHHTKMKNVLQDIIKFNETHRMTIHEKKMYKKFVYQLQQDYPQLFETDKEIVFVN